MNDNNLSKKCADETLLYNGYFTKKITKAAEILMYNNNELLVVAMVYCWN